MSNSTLQTWTVHLTHQKQRVAHAEVAVTAWMPDSTQYLPTRASVHYVGNGNYRLDSLTFPRSGWWNIALVIDGDFGTDSVAFNVVFPHDQRITPPSIKSRK